MLEDDQGQSDGLGEHPEDLELEGYVLQREISRGGQAIIFSAIKKSTGRKVAIKFFPGGSYATRKEKVRMDREVRVLAALDHPNIVSVIDRGQTTDGSTYFVLEYVRGKTLAEFIDDFWDQQGRPKTVDDLKPILQLFVRIAEAINAAHLRGVVHRDLKPSNIVIDSYGEPHILDFGVALSAVPLMDEAGDALPSVTWTGEFLGSVQWASPEQAEGDQTKVDIRSDVYSLGIILYEALTGDFPYDVFGTLPNVLKNIMSAKPRPPSTVFKERYLEDAEETEEEPQTECPIDPALDSIVMRALEKNRADRFQTAGELAKALAGYLTGNTVSLRSPFARHKRWPPITIGAIAAIILAIAASWLTRWQLQRAIPAPDEVPLAPEVRSPRFRALNVFGYLIDDNDVIFDFDPRDYDFARLADGSLGLVENIPAISRVSVAGPFNDWDPLDTNWVMRRTVRDRFQLRVPLDLFESRQEWPFKFVINDRIWVSAPTAADNKEMVIEDTATYNLIFVNPRVQEDDDAQDLRQYRDQINASWPGQSENLVKDSAGGLHLTLTRMDPATQIINLTVLEGIPLTSLHLGDMRVNRIDILGEMSGLQWLVCNDAVFYSLFSGMMAAIEANDFELALTEMEREMLPFRGVPAFERTRRLLTLSLRGMQALQRHSMQLPEVALRFEDRRYLWIAAPMTWRDARAFAARHGATLASVRSEEQQIWLTEEFGWPSIGRTMWIGGTDELVRNSWGWLTGDPWTFQNWSPGYPDRVDEKARAMAMKYDGWWINQDPLEHKRPFIIEWSE